MKQMAPSDMTTRSEYGRGGSGDTDRMLVDSSCASHAVSSLLLAREPPYWNFGPLPAWFPSMLEASHRQMGQT